MRDSFLTTDDFFSLRSLDICDFPLPFRLLFFDPCGRTRESTLDSSANGVSGFDEDKFAPVALTLVLFEPPLCFYEKRGFDEDEKIWTMMKTRNVEPDAVSYRLRMGWMLGDGRLKDAVELFHVMKLSGVNPDVHCFNVLVKGFIGDDNVEEAKVFWEIKEAMKGGRLTTDAEALKQVVEGFVANGMIEEATELVDLAGKKKLEVDWPLTGVKNPQESC
ncbi:pentatricopeptide repeat-containing protein At3g13150-like [Arachis stenosperma]|uniref:pentatricopeptide repeat-containing protein At3g13150-like n=1 Tax=Arachis stenosperma TaxID=217475 RepID=UPI0025AB805C|nr:pentatricopeptide repeat-containing protein At3g13150-like [Arachis stenosperma]